MEYSDDPSGIVPVIHVQDCKLLRPFGPESSGHFTDVS